jgi:signal transduction histidine kinase
MGGPLTVESSRISPGHGVEDGTKARRQESDDARALAHTVSLLEAALESTADGILIVDRSGRMVRSNDRFARMWRIPHEIVANGNDDLALSYVLDQLADPEAFLQKVRALYASPEESSYDTLCFRDGRVIERYSQPQRLGDAIVGRVWSFRDVTARVRAEEERDRLLEHEKAARVAAEDAVRMRDEFLSIASHELRTPLTSLTLFAQALAQRLELGEAVDTAELRRALELSGRQIRRLTALVGLLLDVSRARRGDIALKLERVDLSALVSDVCSLLSDQAARSGSTLSVSGDRMEGTWDRLRLEQVVTNLVTNAIKFGRARPIRVALAREDGMARLTVEDQGIGIPADVQARIFEPFVRGVSSRNFGGLGLGLYITRAIVLAHGGSVAIESEPGKGTRFVVLLPIAAKGPS